MMKKNITGIDGLRTFGVLMVIFYHISPAIFAGGYLGVLIFFVLSGYLITASLLSQYEKTDGINWKEFFIKRLKRIYPLMLAVFLISTLFFTFLQPRMLINIRNVFLSTLFSVNNWWQIANGSSYFTNFAETANNAFKHLYFLSIEGQFYIFLALLMIFLPKKDHKKLSFAIILFLSIASAVAMALLFQAKDPTRVYYGTDTRLFSLLIGMALAFVWRREKLKARLAPGKRVLGVITAVLLFAGIIVMLFLLPDRLPFTYQGGMYLFSLFVAGLLALFAHPALSVNHYFTNSFFRYIGSRSYGIYLWQLPFFVALENWGINIAVWYNIIWELLVILILSELSYRFIEKPSQKLTWEKIRTHKPFVSVEKLPYYALFPLALISFISIFSAPTEAKDITNLQKHIQESQKKTTEKNEKILEKAEEDAKSSAKNKEKASGTKSSSSSSFSNAANSSNENINQMAATISPATAEKAKTMPVVAIGDSVMLDISGQLQSLFPQMYINGFVGRQASESASSLSATPPSILNAAQAFLMDLGINGTVTLQDIDGVMKIAGDRPVYWVNVRVPRPWQDGNNATLQAAVKKYPNFHIIDWFDVSNNHPEYFVSDQVHLTTEGVKVYSNLVTNMIAKP